MNQIYHFSSSAFSSFDASFDVKHFNIRFKKIKWLRPACMMSLVALAWGVLFSSVLSPSVHAVLNLQIIEYVSDAENPGNGLNPGFPGLLASYSRSGVLVEWSGSLNTDSAESVASVGSSSLSYYMGHSGGFFDVIADVGTGSNRYIGALTEGFGDVMTGSRLGTNSPTDTLVVMRDSSMGSFGVANTPSGFVLTLPCQYQSGSTLSGSMRFVDQSFESMGIVENYDKTIDIFDGDDRLRVSSLEIIPEPSTYALFLGVIACCIICLCRKR